MLEEPQTPYASMIWFRFEGYFSARAECPSAPVYEVNIS